MYLRTAHAPFVGLCVLDRNKCVKSDYNFMEYTRFHQIDWNGRLRRWVGLSGEGPLTTNA